MTEILNRVKGGGSTITIDSDVRLHDHPAIGRVPRLRGIFVAQAETPIGRLIAIAPDFGHMKDPTDAALPKENAPRRMDPTDTRPQRRKVPSIFQGQRGPKGFA